METIITTNNESEYNEISNVSQNGHVGEQFVGNEKNITSVSISLIQNSNTALEFCHGVI